VLAVLAAGARVLGSGIAAATFVIVIVVAVLFPTAVGETADVTADATEPTPVMRAVRATDLGFTAAVVVALFVVIIVTLGERHLVHPVVEHTLVVRPEPRLVVHCPEHIGRRRQGERR
jgi:hypothetical protein